MTVSFIWQQLRRWWFISLLVFVLDYLSKWWIESSLHYAEEIAVLPVFDLTLRYNTGAAFSFLAGAGGWQRWFFSVIAIAVIIGLSWRLVKISRSRTLEAWALSFILGGALGNLFDRLAYGHVVDFLQFHWQNAWYFPAFNLADSAITVGVALMLLDGFLSKEKAVDIKNESNQ